MLARRDVAPLSRPPAEARAGTVLARPALGIAVALLVLAAVPRPSGLARARTPRHSARSPAVALALRLVAVPSLPPGRAVPTFAPGGVARPPAIAVAAARPFAMVARPIAVADARIPEVRAMAVAVAVTEGLVAEATAVAVFAFTLVRGVAETVVAALKEGCVCMYVRSELWT